MTPTMPPASSRWRFLPTVLLLCHAARCQRYAERTPPQMDTRPLLYDDGYSDYGTETYDFAYDADVYRWNVEEYPHPVATPLHCHRERASHVCDPDRILTKEQADDLDKIIETLFQDTPCICKECTLEKGGLRFGIALMKYIFQPYNEHPSRIIRTFAEHLRKSWTLGECNNDILIVLATTDRLFYTDVGSETANYISSEEAYQIFVDNKALFTARNFSDGLKAMLATYQDSTKGMVRIEPEADRVNVSMIVGLVIGIVAVVAVVALVAFFCVKKFKSSKDDKIDQFDDNAEGDRSSWRRKDIKVMFGSLLSTEKTVADQYRPCKTDDEAKTDQQRSEDDELIDTTLQTCVNVPDRSAAAADPEEVTSSPREGIPEVDESEEDEENNVTENDVCFMPEKISSFGSPSEYLGPVTNF